MKRNLVIWGGVAYLLLRWVLATQPGYLADVRLYKYWMFRSAQDGLSQVYRTADCDYPPVLLYFLYPLGKLSGAIWPSESTDVLARGATDVVVRIPAFLMDAAIAVLLYRFAKGIASRAAERSPPAHRGEEGGESARGRGPPGGGLGPVALAGLYLLNPVIPVDNGLLGQTDSVNSFFVLAAFLSLANRRAWPSWVLLTLAALTKPQAVPFFLLLLAASLAIYGLRRTLAGIGIAGLAALVVALPWVLSGELIHAVRAVVLRNSLMPYMSANAHNLWWPIGAWRDATVPWLGPFNATEVGIAVFLLFYLAVLFRGRRVHRSQPEGIQPPQVLAMAVMIAFGFFMFITVLHENHLFSALPLLLPLAVAAPRLRRRVLLLYGAVSFSVLSNLLLHMPTIVDGWPFTLGGPSGVECVQFHRPFFVAELWSIRFSVWWTIATFAVALYWFFRPEGCGWLEQLRGAPWSRAPIPPPAGESPASG